MLRSAKQLRDAEDAFESCPVDIGMIQRLIEAAERKKADGARAENSCDTRTEAFYDAGMCVALALLNATRWKTRSRDKHHAFALEAACSLVGASQGLFERMDSIRELRNQKYMGIARTEKDVATACVILGEFEGLAKDWLSKHWPPK
jgi:hypothetical protein